MMFRNRSEAGNRLGTKLDHYKGRKDVIVLALPRGGVVTGYELARALGVPLDVLIVRKIGVPWQPELAAGAIAETGSVVMNRDVLEMSNLSEDVLKPEIEQQKSEIARRVVLYRHGRSLGRLEGKTVILVDDGVATGATMKAAISALRQEKLARLVAALPVAPPETAAELQKMVDEFICLETPHFFMAVGAHYGDFTQVEDEEVVNLLHQAVARAA